MVSEYGYEYDAILDEELFAQTKGRTTDALFHGALCLRSGRDALKTVAREYTPTVALLPSLACDSMVLPFLSCHHRVRFYKINKDYSIDLNSVEEKLSNFDSTVLFLYMEYFGVSAISDAELDGLRSKHSNIVFIEDRTHNLLLESKSLFKPEFTLGSLRKWANIPDGGLLWAHRPLNNTSFTNDTLFSETRLKAQFMRNQFLQNGNQSLKTEYRHIFSTVSHIIDEDSNPSRMSEYAYQIASRTDWDIIENIRKENAQILIDELMSAPVRFIQPDAGNGDLYVAILVEQRNELQRKLSSIGIYCTVIWPLNKEQKAICPTAKYTEEHMLAIYCDQRYSADDMKYVSSEIKRLIVE